MNERKIKLWAGKKRHKTFETSLEDNTCIIMDVFLLYQEIGLCKSKSEARRLISQGGARIDNYKIPNNCHYICFRFIDNKFSYVGLTVSDNNDNS